MGKQKGAPQNTPAIVALKRAGVEFRVHEYRLTAEEATYGESVAKSLGVEPSRMYKTLIAVVDGSPVLAVVPTDRQLGLKALAAAAGGKRAMLADTADAERWTGYVTGGISPFGQKKQLRAFVDRSIEEHATLFVSGGQRGLQLELRPADFLVARQVELVDGLGA
jgi:Cys-tRNA(Pro)/Cys-tRNA(Cys) deacylase